MMTFQTTTGIPRNLYVATDQTKTARYYYETGFVWFTRYAKDTSDGPTRLGFAITGYRYAALALRDVYVELERVGEYRCRLFGTPNSH